MKIADKAIYLMKMSLCGEYGEVVSINFPRQGWRGATINAGQKNCA
jgi:hypothetical protein